MSDNKKDFNKKLFKIVAPVAFQNLMLALVAVSDAFMLGNVEQNAMSAVSLATQIQFIQNIIVSAVISATSVMGAQYWGKKDERSVNHVFALALYISASISILTFMGCVFMPHRLMQIFTNESTLIEIGAKYLQIAGWSYLFTGITQIYLTVMKITEHAGTSAMISSAAVIINVIFNGLLIFGVGMFPKMGVEGAAIATLIARAVEFAWTIAVSFKKGYMHPNLNSFVSIEGLLAKDFAKCLMPLLGACLFWGVGFSSYTAFMGHLGEDAAAANSVTAVIRDLVCCVCDGLAVGGGIIVGNELGAGNLTSGKLYGDRVMKLSIVVGVISTVVMAAVTPLILMSVKLTVQAREYLLWMMLVMAFYMIGRSINAVVINGIFAAGGDTMFDFYSLAVAMWGISIPLAALGTFVWHFPVIVIYAFTCLDEVGKIPWVMYHYKKYKWVKDLTRELTPSEE